MSRGLGQTELLTPPPVKKLLVPDGFTCWFGVDPSSVRVAIGSITADGVRGVTVQPFAGRDAGRVLSAYTQTREVMRDLIAHSDLLPGVIAVEQPSGRTPNPMLLYSTGAILAALASSVPASVRIVMVTSSAWKSVACGHGSIRKPQKVKGQPAPAPEDYPVLRWAREQGYAGTSWDAADAYGICEWARRTYALEAR